MTAKEYRDKIKSGDNNYEDSNLSVKDFTIKQMKGFSVIKPSKYHNKKTYVDDTKFDSKREAKYYQELKLRELAGEIKDIKLQPEFELQEHFRWEGKMERAIVYRADFLYFDVELDKIVIVDVKGMKTDVYKIKRKLFLYTFIEPHRDLYIFKEVY